jgi:hypothetical protein
MTDVASAVMAKADISGARIRAYLDELGITWETTGDETVKVDAGTTAVYLSSAERAGRSVVSLLAPVLSDVEAPAERLVELLALNAQLSFGKFSWYPAERMISVEYELLGDFLDRDELAVALQAVGEIADTCDARLQPILGGRMPHVA